MTRSFLFDPFEQSYPPIYICWDHGKKCIRLNRSFYHQPTDGKPCPSDAFMIGDTWVGYVDLVSRPAQKFPYAFKRDRKAELS